ncbi:DUF5681 domain-containing protein [Thiorhodococcus minor]|uniref:DUF5681 domain-containing protein n=1 Tax=Thiorhodococcus minor TaxID=57489 RepID=A0A6M0JVX1_9GAMM|nr:DUF5681 domain-containing protein [Thiorhodococcus minor]NEV61658.1 hypothetical protein [Thiorhodococcus minor]
MAFEKGKSGNPKGRPRGIVNQAKLRKAIEKDLPEIIEAMTTAAKAGDTAAARLLVDKVLPSLKPQDTPVKLPLGDDLAESGRAVLAAVGASEVTPEQGARILQGLGALSRVIETDELLRRIEALEKRYGESD